MWSLQALRVVARGVWFHRGFQGLRPARPLARAVFKAGPGRAESCRELRGLASKPKGPRQVQPWKRASSGRAPATPTANKTPSSSGPWPLQGPCLSQAGRYLPVQKSEPKHQPCPTAGWVCGVRSAWQPGHPQLSGSSDSWGGKESHSPGSDSPRWCLLGPGGLGGREEKVRAGKTVSPCTSPSHPQSSVWVGQHTGNMEEGSSLCLHLSHVLLHAATSPQFQEPTPNNGNYLIRITLHVICTCSAFFLHFFIQF